MLRLLILLLLSSPALGAGSAPAVNTDLGCTAAGHAYQYSGSAMTCAAPTRPSATVGGTLPTCNAGNLGRMYWVTNATAPVALATVVGGGAVAIGVTCNGTNWIVQ